MKKAFTLIELSIVLIMIALISGGVVAGRIMMDQARLRAINTEKEQYLSAILQFKDRFKGIPGDSSKARAIWGCTDSSGLGCLPAVADGTNLADDGNLTWNDECYWAWRHLSLSGLITNSAKTADGHYTGAKLNGGGQVSGGVNAPLSKAFSSGIWVVQGAPAAWSWSIGYVNTDEWQGQSQLRLAEDKLGPGGSKYPHPWNGPLTVQEIYMTDMKYDDGYPSSGKIAHHAPRYVSVTNDPIYHCSTSTDSDVAEYDLTMQGRVCHIVYWLPLR